MPGDSITTRPGVFKQIIGSKQTVEQWKMHRKIYINSSGLDSVVPMMKAGRYKDFFEQSQPPAEIGLHKR